MSFPFLHTALPCFFLLPKIHFITQKTQPNKYYFEYSSKYFAKSYTIFLFFIPKIIFTNQKYSKTISNLKYFFRKIFFLTHLNSVFHPIFHPTSEKEKMNRFIPKSSTKINSESIHFKEQTNLFLIYQLISTPNQTKTNPTRITNQFIPTISTNFQPTKTHHKLNNNFCRFFAPKSFKPDKNYNS